MFRSLLIVCGALVATTFVSRAQTMSAACAERDLQVIAFIEQHGEAGDLSDATLGELGMMHLQARLTCVAGKQASALAIYDDILSTTQIAEVGP